MRKQRIELNRGFPICDAIGVTNETSYGTGERVNHFDTISLEDIVK